MSADGLQAECTKWGLDVDSDKMGDPEYVLEVIFMILQMMSNSRACFGDPAVLTTDMFSNYVCKQFQEIVFLRDKGPKWAVPKSDGGYDLYGAPHERELKSAFAALKLNGIEHNFRPWGKIRDLPFDLMWDKMLKPCDKWHQKDKVMFFPAIPPYEGVPQRRKQQLENGNDLNLFMKLGITESEARAYCLEYGILCDADFENGRLTNAGMHKLCEVNKCILEHQRLIICRGNEEDYVYLLSHQAHMVQKPWEKPKVAIVMRSDGKGAGKGVLAHHLLAIVGCEGASKHAASVSDANAVLGDFNGVRSGKILLMLALVSTGAVAHSRQFASSTVADRKPTWKAFWQRCGRWACIVTLVPTPMAWLDPLGTTGCAGHHALAFTTPTPSTRRGGARDWPLQGVWFDEGTRRILTLDSILLLHASQFCILGGKPLVPEKIFGLITCRSMQSRVHATSGGVGADAPP
jgi:hypothetical protein